MSTDANPWDALLAHVRALCDQLEPPQSRGLHEALLATVERRQADELSLDLQRMPGDFPLGRALQTALSTCLYLTRHAEQRPSLKATMAANDAVRWALRIQKMVNDQESAP